MGAERAGKRKHLFLHLACGLILSVGLSGCTLFPSSWRGEKSIDEARLLMAKGDYEGSLRESETLLRASRRTRGDKALFQMGLVYAHPENPNSDYRKSKESFQIILDEFPQSPLRYEAKIFSALLQKIQDKDQAIADRDEALAAINKRDKLFKEELTKKKSTIENLTEEIRKLQEQIERLKEVDLKIEEKKRESLHN